MEKELLFPTLEMKIKGEFTLHFPIHLTFPFFLDLLQIKKQPSTPSFIVVFKYEKVTFVWFTNTDYVPALRPHSLNRDLVEKKESWVPKQLTTASVGTSQHSRISVLVAVSQFTRLWKMKFQLSHDMQTTEFSVSWKSRMIPSSLVRGEEKALWHHSFKSSQHCSFWVPKL